MRCSASLSRRLDRLEPKLRPVGCAICRDWTRVLLVGNDGPLRPEACPGCGRVVGGLTRVYVGVRLAAV